MAILIVVNLKVCKLIDNFSIKTINYDEDHYASFVGLPFEQCFGICIQFALVNQAKPAKWFAAEEDILSDGHVRNRRELLMNHRNPQL